MKDERIYRKGPTQWTSYVKGASATRLSPIYFQQAHSAVVPTGISLTTVEIISDRIIIFEGTDYTDIDEIPSSITVKCDSFWVLDNSTINTRCNDEWVAQGLLEGTLRAVCDGSYKPKLNEDDKSTSNITGTISTSGITSDPYRGELLGISAILSAISYIERSQ